MENEREQLVPASAGVVGEDRKSKIRKELGPMKETIGEMKAILASIRVLLQEMEEEEEAANVKRRKRPQVRRRAVRVRRPSPLALPLYCRLFALRLVFQDIPSCNRYSAPF